MLHAAHYAACLAVIALIVNVTKVIVSHDLIISNLAFDFKTFK